METRDRYRKLRDFIRTLFISLTLLLLFLKLDAKGIVHNSPSRQNIEIQELIKTQVEKDRKYDSLINEQNKQITALTQTIASAKESYYNSSISNSSYVLAAIGLVILIAGGLGLNNISSRLKENKQETEARSSELKADFRDFKADVNNAITKFEVDAQSTINRSLDNSYKKAVDNIVKGTYGQSIESMEEQIADLTNKVNELFQRASGNSNNGRLENIGNGNDHVNRITKLKNDNAFD